MKAKYFFAVIWGIIWRSLIITFWFFVADSCFKADFSIMMPVMLVIAGITGVAASIGVIAISVNLLKFISAALTGDVPRRLLIEGTAVMGIAIIATFFLKAYLGGTILFMVSLCWLWKAAEVQFHNNFPDQG